MRLRRFGRRLIVLGATASLLIGTATAQAHAVIVGSPPTSPIPQDVAAGPPPIPDLPAATAESPPSDQIADPVTPGAVCGGWHQEGNYGDRWPASSTWWEYQCTHQEWRYHNTCEGPACDAWCPSCYSLTEDWTDHFYWNGLDPVFYGQSYTQAFLTDQQGADGSGPTITSHWWDGPSAQWYSLTNAAPSVTFTSSCVDRDCRFDPTGSVDSDGWITTYRWEFGDGLELTQAGGSTEARHTYSADGTYTVTVTATDDDGATASAGGIVTVSGNRPPIATFTFNCSGLSCTFDGSGSSDGDGTISAYSWTFGDGGSASGRLAGHTYAQPGTFTVTLAVTDDNGATAPQSKAVTVVTVVTLTARGYKMKGVQKVDLSWSGSSAGSFHVFRNAVKIATVPAAVYTDNVGKGGGTYAYKVCESGTAICSNEATVSFGA
jgi:PKD repeat protein